MEYYCPNIEVCKLVVKEDFIDNESKRIEYLVTYCKSPDKRWNQCTRFIVNNTINFCPDFVLPDSEMTPNEVIDKFDEDCE